MNFVFSDRVADETRRQLSDESLRRTRALIRFCGLSAESLRRAERIGVERSLRLHLNPVRAWLPQSTAPGDDRDAVTMPGAVVLFAHGDEIRRLTTSRRQRLLLHQLAEIEPATLDAWLAHDEAIGQVGATFDELVALAKLTVAAGLTSVS